MVKSARPKHQPFRQMNRFQRQYFSTNQHNFLSFIIGGLRLGSLSFTLKTTYSQVFYQTFCHLPFLTSLNLWSCLSSDWTNFLCWKCRNPGRQIWRRADYNRTLWAGSTTKQWPTLWCRTCDSVLLMGFRCIFAQPKTFWLCFPNYRCLAIPYNGGSRGTCQKDICFDPY